MINTILQFNVAGDVLLSIRKRVDYSQHPYHNHHQNYWANNFR